MSRSIDEKKLKPVADRVAIRPDARDKETKSGLIKPDSLVQKTKNLTGEVIAVGPGKPGEPMMVKKGDAVIFGEHDGTEIGDGILIMPEHRILSII
jgi:chaperonin GroES